MPNHVSDAELYEWAHNRLAQDRWKEIAAHLDVCDECPKRLHRLDGPPSGGETPPDGWPSTIQPKGCRDVPDVPGYTDIEWLAGGGMGVVYRARHVRLDRLVALKLVRMEQMSPDLLARLEAEARAVARLDHPHIVKVYDVGQCRPAANGSPVPYIALEYLPGGSLGKRLVGQALSPGEAARLVMLLARAVAHAHERSIVHRDLKLDNVLLAAPADEPALNTSLGCPKITDFGLARQEQGSRRLTGAGAVLGTPAYMAPEQANGRPNVGQPADVWALGVILYRLLTGKLPFEAEELTELLYLICRQAPTSPRALTAGVPEGLERICLDCLEKEPGRRPTAKTLAEQLEGVCEEWRRREAVLRPGRGRLGPARRKFLLAGLGALAAAVTVSVAVFLLRVWPPSSTTGGETGKEQPPVAQRENQTRGEEKGRRGALKPSLKVRLRVLHYDLRAGKNVPLGPIGWKSMEAQVYDRIVVKAELSAPGYCYVIGLNCNGKDELLWPYDEKKKKGDPTLAPPQLERLQCPPPPADGANQPALRLDDNRLGGMQGYIVVASEEALLPYEEWERGRAGEVPWGKLPASRGVWRCDGETLDTVQAGEVRSTVVELKGAPPLLRLCRWARDPEVTVEAIAFPVYRKEK